MLREQFDITSDSIKDILQQPKELKIHETGEVVSVGKGVAIVNGLPGVRAQELVIFSDQVQGIAFNLDDDSVGVVLLGQSHKLAAGSQVRRTGRVVDVPVGRELLGRVINPNGDFSEVQACEATRAQIQAAVAEFTANSLQTALHTEE